MTFYLDTSVVVSALTHEAATPVIQAWLAQASDQPLVISDWVITEFASALSLKQRTGQIDEAFRLAAVAEFDRLRLTSFTALTVDSQHFHLAARLISKPNVTLRSGDALHAAMALDNGLTLCTRVDALARDCVTLGVPALRL